MFGKSNTHIFSKTRDIDGTIVILLHPILLSTLDAKECSFSRASRFNPDDIAGNTL
jgi:hypothetical protein